MASIALAFAVLDSGGSATDLGYVLAAGFVPWLVFVLLGGVVADRFGRRKVMLVTDGGRTVIQGALAAALFVGHPPIWLFVVLSAGLGVGNAFFQPALSGLAVQIAPTEELADANALFNMAYSGAAVVGPALAGVIVAAANPATVLALDACSYAISALALWGLELPASDRLHGRSLIGDLAQGWEEFRSRTWVWVTTLQFSLFNLIAWGPFLLLGPVLSKEYLGGAGAWGAIVTAFGVGSAVGGLAALGRHPSQPLLVALAGTLGSSVPLAMLALSAGTPDVAAATLVAGVGATAFNIFWSTAIQQQVPEQAQARVHAFVQIGVYSGTPIAYAGAGALTTLINPHLILGIGAAWSAATSLIVIALPTVRAVRWRTAAAEDADSSLAAATHQTERLKGHHHRLSPNFGLWAAFAKPVDRQRQRGPDTPALVVRDESQEVAHEHDVGGRNE